MEKANKLGDTIAIHSLSSKYVPNFQKVKEQQEKNTIYFNSYDGEDCNELFSISYIPALVKFMILLYGLIIQLCINNQLFLHVPDTL